MVTIKFVDSYNNHLKNHANDYFWLIDSVTYFKLTKHNALH